GSSPGQVNAGVEHASASTGAFLADTGALIPLGFAFGAGVVSAVNPCGFTMLPVYLGLYLGARGAERRTAGGQLRRGLGGGRTGDGRLRRPLRRRRDADRRRRAAARQRAAVDRSRRRDGGDGGRGMVPGWTHSLCSLGRACGRADRGSPPRGPARLLSL